MAEATTITLSTSTTTTTQEKSQPTAQMVLHLRGKPKTDKKVQWGEEVVDNEFMGKKKSKCCCIYTKPHKNGDDSDTSDDDGDWDDCCHEHKVARQRVPHSK
ncbi:PREDICTED: protein phosphatase 1 regulatory subunit 11-like [Amphimedon queenslandica]|uniref:E3 ubiquitin-protein ligase PPP1R11 n=1 Tax=Amphimedon queenslandica TaxID=400682 RepID=A0A1X7U9I4_AMPQE|nr:PREDICTED: protein phosphatase 1 regulatory subunit 11-like [Amphimedon queenslandica]|eukprot:XP_003388545.1 PREDICTED: protein phosphatase 1 regulatory subunit 11-like [Amphimedon queenslandica]